MKPLSPKVIRILGLIEEEPRYGKQICDMDPTCFATDSAPEPHAATVYKVMSGLEKRGLIERKHNYVAPKRKRGPHHQTVSRAVWYQLTELGKDELGKARKILNGATEEPEHEEPEEVPRPRNPRRSQSNAQ